MINKQKYILANDDDGHWYIFPVEHKAEFDTWLEAVYSEDYDFENEEAYTQPDWCKSVDGPHSILIHSYETV
jgi:hypothetical protein